MIEILQTEATRLQGIEFEDTSGQKFLFKDGVVLIIRPSRRVAAVESSDSTV